MPSHNEEERRKKRIRELEESLGQPQDVSVPGEPLPQRFASLEEARAHAQRRIDAGVPPERGLAPTGFTELVDNLVAAFPTTIVEGIQRLIPGEQELERLTREVGPFQAFREADFPSAKRVPTVSPLVDILGSLVGIQDASRFSPIRRTDIGVKGAFEAFLQPDVLIPGLGPATRGLTGLARAGVKELPAIAATVPPVIAKGRLAAGQQLARIPGAGEAGLRVAGRPGVAGAVDDPIRALEQEIANVAAQIEGLQATRIVRPKWAVGISNDQLQNIARQQGLNPASPDWGDAIDSVLIREARQGGFKSAAEVQPTVSALKTQQRRLRANLAALQKGPIPEESIQTGGVIQRGMGIGEQPPQGALFEGFRGEGGAVPLANREALEAEQASREAVAKVQQALPTEAAGGRVPSPTAAQAAETGAPAPGTSALTPEEIAAELPGPSPLAKAFPQLPEFEPPKLGGPPITPRGFGPDDFVPGRGGFPEIPTIDNVLATDFISNVAQKIGNRLARLPGIRQAFGEQINPSLLANTPAKKAVIAYRGIHDSIDTAAKAAVAPMRTLDNPFSVGPDGTVLNVPIPQGFSDHILDVLTRPDAYSLTPGQQQWVALWRPLRQQRLASFKKKGIKLDELHFDDPMIGLSLNADMGAQGEWFPRVILGREVEGRVIGAAEGVTGAVGRRQAQQKTRQFPLAKDGRAAGFKYMTDPTDIVEFTIKAAYRMELDKDLSNWVKKQPGVRVGKNPEPFAEATVNQPAFRGLVLPRGLADEMGAIFKDQGNTLLRGISNVNDMSRFLQTGFDPGFLFIQGQLALTRRPVVWAKATGKAFEAFLRPEVIGKYLTDNAETVRIMIRDRAAPIAASEYTVAGQSGPIARLPLARRAAAAFNTFMDVARIELRKALGSKITTDVDSRALTNVIDHMMGISSSRNLGVTTTRRQVEGAIFLYAPRYRRAGAALVIDAFQGGIRGSEARKNLGAFLLAGGAFMTGLAYALGQEERILPRADRPIPPMYDPRSSKFMTVRIGNTEAGIGGVYVSMTRMLGRMYGGAERAGVEGVVGAAKQTLRGLSAPTSGLGWSLLSGKDFLGEDIFTLRKMGEIAVELVTPFFVAPYISEGLLDTSRDVPGPERGVMALAGVREFPTRARDLKTEDIFPGREYRDLWPFERDIVNRTPEVMRQANDFTNRINSLNQQEQGRFQELAEAVRTGFLVAKDGTREQQNKRSIVNLYFDAISEFANLRNGAAFAEFGERDFEVNDRDPLKKALGQYYKGLEDSKTSAGNFLSAKWDSILQALVQKWTPEQEQYVLANTSRREVPAALLAVLPASTRGRIQQSQLARQQRLQLFQQGVAPQAVPGEAPQQSPREQRIRELQEALR